MSANVTPLKRSAAEASLDTPRNDDESVVEPDIKAPTPRVSKARACAECKRHKIKCEVKPGETSCTKCRRSGIKCVVNDFSQKFVDDDLAWKAQATSTIKQLQTAVSHLLRHNGLPDLTSFPTPEINADRSPETVNVPSVRRPSDSHDHKRLHVGSAAGIDGQLMTRENSQDANLEEPEIVSAPMRSLYEVTKLRNFGNNMVEKPKSTLLEEDFISRGHVSLHEAQELFAYFSRTMNQLLWGGIVVPHGDLTSVRRASTLLLTAVLTVAALHIPNRTETLNTCYNEYVSLVSSMALTRSHTLDDIRGLCAGAFWLSDLSWKLSGHAVRIATEMGLHQSFQKMTRGQSGQYQYERAQLWYLLYVCDHHYSIAYGRPPVIHDDSSIKNYEVFLQSRYVVPGDIRLMAQVALFFILTQAYHTFGSDAEQPLREEDFGQLRVYNVAVDQWRLLWQPRSADSPYVRTYPSKGVVLHYHFAKFQLNSLALRALSPTNTPVFSMDRKECANAAISAAMACLTMVLEEQDVRDAIVGVPIFTHTMVTFSAVFLLKVAVNWNSAYLNIDGRQVRHTVERVIELMNCVSAGERHLTRHIARGLGKMLDRFNAWDGWYANRRHHHENPSGSVGNGITSGYDGTTSAAMTSNNTNNNKSNGLHTSSSTIHTDNNINNIGTANTGGRRRSIPGGANAMAQGFPPPDLIYDMVGTYGFGLDEQLMDPSIPGFEFLSQ
ncbi:Transcriptional activator of proteases prtT [Talaromyces atroroseus]|uniref:Transcriptional activator of proteases prtT n=1 Tax=Talaromyces atroroseus TaxID=1441469 RepID=A0A1Q5Q888_TALAT|nr:Transcriptional activator of proteases prtT [Talaromyces atroroseus]OKL60343.1 Transcriptional activator of proteases prtT [Talaromyces atroroseus]